MTDDEKVAQRYRELGAEEPPRALDDAILAAARREAAARPGALQARSSRQRWYAPLATAAVLVLAVAVTLNMQIEKPGVESPVQQPVPRAEQPAAKPSSPEAQAPPRAVADDVARAAPAPSAPKAAALARRTEPPAFAPDPPPQAAAAPAPAPSAGASGTLAGATPEREQRAARADLSRERPPAPAAAEAMAKRMEAPARAPAENPERELERIAELRAQGRQDEADRALAEFRKRYPDYRIAEDMLRRVERR